MKQAVKQRIEMTKERLKTSLDNYTIDNLTGFYNHIFLNEYLINELDLKKHQKDSSNNLVLIFIKVDNIMDINIKYSNAVGDETIANLAYLLKEIQGENELVFKKTGPNFVILCHDFEGDLIGYTRNIQNHIKKSEVFIEPITVSAAVISLSEIDYSLENDKIAQLLLSKGTTRINLSHELGNSSYIDKDTIIEKNMFGNVLITESDPLTLSIMKSYFEENRYKVKIASNGFDALSLAKEEKFDAIIADRYIKKIDGLTLKQYINESSMNMNTIFLLTVQSKNVDIINKANLISIDYIFDKPVILQELLGVIKRECARKQCMLL
jgi:diguanylate cyclase (GGDEF)-like protein